jgi:hypothetical protein
MWAGSDASYLLVDKDGSVLGRLNQTINWHMSHHERLAVRSVSPSSEHQGLQGGRR